MRDLVIGMSDGLTVPFALAAGLSGAVNSNGIIITAGLAEIAAGAIAMGLGGYLAAQSDAQHYYRERKREVQEVKERPEEEEREVREVFMEYGLTEEEIAPIMRALRSRPSDWINFMMRFELGMEKPEPQRALKSAITIGGAYVAGGFVPLCSYFFFSDTKLALLFSVVITAFALFIFGYVKGKFTSSQPLRGAWQTLMVGGLAAGTAYFIAHVISK
jgi:VIT1/CCC1 family predicted Fe2+/Mn2+ transporter